MMRHIEVEGSHNVRDLGGYPTADGSTTRWRVLIRAGALDNVTPTGAQQLADYGVKTIVDLRDEREARDFPDRFAQPTQYLNVPFFGDHLSADESWKQAMNISPTLDELYHHYLDRCQPQLGAILAAVIESAPGTLFHCYAGKDRTGLVAALLLHSVGVPAEVIAEDYAQTGQRIAHLVVQWREYTIKNGGDLRITERDSGSAAETMLAALDYLAVRYGGVASYLRLCGVTDPHLARLRTLLVE
jgi:protein-tyrosine phosphatase